MNQMAVVDFCQKLIALRASVVAFATRIEWGISDGDDNRFDQCPECGAFREFGHERHCRLNKWLQGGWE